MYRLLLLTIVFFPFSMVNGQTHINESEMIINKDNTYPKKVTLDSDSNCTSFSIHIKTEVKPHYHAYHTEVIYVTSGAAIMRLGDKKIELKSGDYINIPPKTIHSVKVISEEALEVISVQSPQFHGKDRIWVE